MKINGEAQSEEVHYYTLQQIFDVCQQFQIPEYQRGYAWDKEQVNDLKLDIEDYITGQSGNASAQAEEYFVGTIVLVKKNDNGKFYFEVVDGQQRLISIIILIKTICNIIKDKYKENTDYIISKYIRDLEKLGNPIRFKPNHEIRDFFNRYIIEEHTSVDATSFSHENLENSRSIFFDWLDQKNDKNYLENVLSTITEKFKFIVFIPKGKTIGMMFETINDRGKHLSELEKIKNYFFYIASVFNVEQLKNDIEDNWSEILINLKRSDIKSIKQENDFLRYVYRAFYEESKIRFPKDKTLYDEFKSKVFNRYQIKDDKNSVERIQKFLIFLRKSSESYAYLYNRNYRNEVQTIDKFREVITFLRCHKQHATIMPLYLSIMAKNTSGEDKFKLLSVLEKLNFRLYVMNFLKRTNGQRELSDFAFRYFNDDITVAELERAMTDFILDNSRLENFGAKIKENENLQYWTGIRYLLGRYEQYLRGKKKVYFNVEDALYEENENTEAHKKENSRATLEHIWALKNKKEEFGEHNPEKLRLGNFILMGERYNDKLADKDILEKISLIKNNHEVSFLQAKELIKILEEKEVENLGANPDAEKLSKAINNIREDKLIKFAMNTWKVNGD